MSEIKKLYLDTRFRTSGEHYDASFELPFSVEVKNTQSAVLGSMSFNNTLETVQDLNNQLYFQVQEGLHIRTGVNDGLYLLKEVSSLGVGQIALLYEGLYTIQTLAAELQRALRVLTPEVAVAADGDAGVQITLPAGIRFYFPTGEEVSSPAWKANNWGAGPPYDPANPRMFRAITGPSGYAQTFRADVLLSLTYYTFGYIATVQSGYFEGDTFAAAIQAALRIYVANATVTYNDVNGTMSIDSGNDFWLLFFPTADQLRNPQWRDANWPSPSYPTSNPRSINGALSAPQGFSKVVQTAQINLATIREIYVHSNLSNYSTLASNGAADIIAKIIVDVPFGNIQSYRPFSGLDSESIRMPQGSLRNITLTLRDAYGVLIKLDHYVSYEITFLENPF